MKMKVKAAHLAIRLGEAVLWTAAALLTFDVILRLASAMSAGQVLH